MKSEMTCPICGVKFMGTKERKVCSFRCSVKWRAFVPRSEEARRKTSETLKDLFANNPEKKERLITNLRNAVAEKVKAGWRRTVSSEGRARMSEAQRARYDGRLNSEINKTRAYARRLEVVYPAIYGKEATGVGAMGEENPVAKQYTLCDPNGVVYDVVNLQHFVRTHEHLFPKSTLNWKTRSRNGSDTVGHRVCAALEMLYRVGRGERCSWRGWRVVNLEKTPNARS